MELLRPPGEITLILRVLFSDGPKNDATALVEEGALLLQFAAADAEHDIRVATRADR